MYSAGVSVERIVQGGEHHRPAELGDAVGAHERRGRVGVLHLALDVLRTHVDHHAPAAAIQLGEPRVVRPKSRARELRALDLNQTSPFIYVNDCTITRCRKTQNHEQARNTRAAREVEPLGPGNAPGESRKIGV